MFVTSKTETCEVWAFLDGLFIAHKHTRAIRVVGVDEAGLMHRNGKTEN